MNRICTSLKSLYTVSGFTMAQYCNALNGQPGLNSKVTVIAKRQHLLRFGGKNELVETTVS